MEIATLILSILSFVLAIISIVISTYQNRKLHNENLKLSSKPQLDISLLFDNKIGGKIIEEKNVIDSINVWKSKYSNLYVSNFIKYDNIKKALFTILIKNNGNGVANDICIEKIQIQTKTNIIVRNEKIMVLSSCNAGETKANKIFINECNDVETVLLTISFTDLLNKKCTLTYNYVTDENKDMLRYVNVA